MKDNRRRLEIKIVEKFMYVNLSQSTYLKLL